MNDRAQNHTKIKPKSAVLLSIVSLFATLSLVLSRTMLGEPIPPPPKPSQLESGDLIWPKKPGVVVPYDSRPGAEAKNTADRWKAEKDAYLAHLKAEPQLDKEDEARFALLSPMTYDAFKSYYLRNVVPGGPTNFGAGPVYTGHVGIIRIVNSVPHVVEAMLGRDKGVQQLSYGDWLAGRPGEIFWLGRLKGLTPQIRAAVAEKAATEIGKPYNFWNFNLADNSAFYCSKLAWLSIKSAAGFAPDDNMNPKRVLWYSPKQLMSSRHIELIGNPQDY